MPSFTSPNPPPQLSNLAQAQQHAAELDQVTAALAIVNSGTFSAVLELGNARSAAARVRVTPQQAALVTLLTNRQTALQNQLTALGVT